MSAAADRAVDHHKPFTQFKPAERLADKNGLMAGQGPIDRIGRSLRHETNDEGIEVKRLTRTRRRRVLYAAEGKLERAV